VNARSSPKTVAHRAAVVAPGRDVRRLRASVSSLVEAAETSDLPAGAALYLFGSSCEGHAAPRDIDVLLVYPNGCLSQAQLLAESVHSAATSSMFDVLLLSVSEEHELAFILTERASLIWLR
jgi:hypothetical protein